MSRSVFSVLCCALLALCPARGEEPGFYPAWSEYTPQQIAVQVDRAMERGRSLVRGVCRLAPGAMRFDNVFGTLDCAAAEVFNTTWPIIMLRDVRRSPELDAAWEKAVPRLTLQREMRSSEPLRRVVGSTAQRLLTAGTLSPMQAYYVRSVLRDFALNTTAPDVKTRPGEPGIAAVEQELGRLTREFARRVAAEKAALRLTLPDAACLAGMPAAWVQSRCRGGQPVLSVADVPEVLARCTVRDTRRMVWQRRAQLCRSGGAGDTTSLVPRILELRQRKAELLGLAHYADYVGANTMLGSGKAAAAFVEAELERLRPAFEAEVRELLQCASREQGRAVQRLEPWDVPFYRRKLQEASLDGLSSAAFSPYLELESLRQRMFSFFAGLYNLRIEELPTACPQQGMPCPAGKVEVWAPAVRLFRVSDAATGAHLGSFYWDAYRRPDKSPQPRTYLIKVGEPATNLRPHGPHLAVISLAFPPPQGQPPLPPSSALIVFHEFGHALHYMFADAPARSRMGVGLAPDFVELPSLLHELWFCHADCIRYCARHPEDGSPMPPRMVQAMQRLLRESAIDAVQQLALAKLDLAMHMDPQRFAGGRFDAAAAAVLAGTTLPLTEPEPCPVFSGLHCMGAYGASYYSYPHGRYLARLVFSRLEQMGACSRAAAAEYRRCLLAPSACLPPGEMLRDFLQRTRRKD
ncbi:MAG: M3 family metallopeptidase [Akkermansia sp.]|nr:M3 family metallopeptidase [Akkermansia sp.]